MNAQSKSTACLNAFVPGFRGAILLLSVAGNLAWATTRYVNLSNPTPSSPYTSWATAATNIQNAVDVAVSGDLVLVNDGLYQTGGRIVFALLTSVTNRVAVTKPLKVQSVNGPAATIIQGRQIPGTTNGFGAMRCGYLTNGAYLVGLTLL